MTTGWESLEEPVVEADRSPQERGDPVSDFNFAGSRASDAVFVDSVPPEARSEAAAGDHDLDHDEHGGMGDQEHDQRAKKKGLGIWIAMGAMAAVTFGGLYAALSPVLAIFNPPTAQVKPNRGAIMAIEAMKTDGAQTAASAAAKAASSAAVAAVAAAAPAPAVASIEPPAAPAISPVASATVPAVIAAANASAPAEPAQVAAVKAASSDPSTASAVAAVLANAQRAVPVPAAPPAPVAAAAQVPVATAAAKPAPKVEEGTGPKVAAVAAEPVPGAAPPKKADRAKRTNRSAAVRSRASRAAKSQAPTGGSKAKVTNQAVEAERAPEHTAGVLVGYTLLAINPRTGDYQQAWVRDALGKLQIVGKGDRLGTLQVLRVDGARGEVLTPAGIIR
ncbi:MAG: hypothetical protein K0Q43_67 [Ramlibacter sp.]|jgi:hypothetical protein|nr:hypothetical protein [Ramlibacter sp.]